MKRLKDQHILIIGHGLGNAPFYLSFIVLFFKSIFIEFISNIMGKVPLVYISISDILISRFTRISYSTKKPHGGNR